MHLQIHPEVADALESGRPVVALESTIISHGLPRPDNLRVAREIEDSVRSGGAVPATIAVVDGIPRIGLDDDALRTVAEDDSVVKVSVRDLGTLVAKRGNGATTVAATSHLASLAGHPRLRHGRPRRRAPRGSRHLGRVGRPHHPVDDARDRRVRRGEVDPRRRRHPRAPRDPQRAGARLPHRPLPRLLPRRLRIRRRLAGGRPRRGRGGDARARGPRVRRRPRRLQPGRAGGRARPHPARQRPHRRARRGRPGGRAGQGRHAVPARVLPHRHAGPQPRGQRRAGPQQRRPRRRDRRRPQRHEPRAARRPAVRGRSAST